MFRGERVNVTNGLRSNEKFEVLLAPQSYLTNFLTQPVRQYGFETGGRSRLKAMRQKNTCELVVRTIFEASVRTQILVEYAILLTTLSVDSP